MHGDLCEFVSRPFTHETLTYGLYPHLLKQMSFLKLKTSKLKIFD